MSRRQRLAFVVNRRRLARDHDEKASSPLTRQFHGSIPGFRPTPVVELPGIARQLGLGGLWCKDESVRLALDSFKILGSSWAVAERVRREWPGSPSPRSFEAVRDRIAAPRPVLCTATDGNHGRAIAALAEWLGLDSHILMARGAAGTRVAAVERHGGHVETVDLSYDETVDAARERSADLGFWYCPDTATADAGPGELAFASDVADGYATIWDELLDDMGKAPDVVFVQAGVGALAASAVRCLGGHVRVVTVEPLGSACVLASLRLGEPTAVDDSPTSMSGLRCQSVSAVAWPILHSGLAAAMGIDDEAASEAVEMLAGVGIRSGDSGAAGLAGLIVAARTPAVRRAVGLSPTATVAVVNTEAPNA